MDLKIKRYEKQYENIWDEFIEQNSVNGTFLQERKFLNYHGEQKFEDASIMFFMRERVIAVCPACTVTEDGKRVFVSHCGSTYGGIVLGRDMLRIDKVRQIYEAFEVYLAENGFEKCILKITMDLLCQYPQDVIKFYMKYSGYREMQELNFYIDFAKYDPQIMHNFSKMKRRNVKKCIQEKMEMREVTEAEDIRRLHCVLVDNLLKYDVKPVHSADELVDLQKRLGEKIEFYGVYQGETLLAVSVVFLFEKTRCVHTQYLAAYSAFKEKNPMSFLYYKITELYYKRGYRYLSWGTATEHGGNVINWGLANNKEEFGSLHVINSIFEKTILLHSM